MSFEIETELETDGRWIAEIAAIPGAVVHGSTRSEAVQKVQAHALRVVADRLQHSQASKLVHVTFHAA